MVNEHEDWVFAVDSAEYTLRDHFGVQSLDGFGLKGRHAATGAAGGALHYLANTLRRDVAHLRPLTFYQNDEFLTLDGTTLRNLEILEPLTRDAPNAACLYSAVNQTVTQWRTRLRDWLTQPLSDAATIHARHTPCKRGWKTARVSNVFVNACVKCAIWNAPSRGSP